MIAENKTLAPMDCVRWVLEAVSQCRAGTSNRIELPEGTYEIRPDELPEKPCYISNHDSGLKRILFDLEGLENIVIEGNGSELRCLGRVIPFFLKDCKNITIRNLTIDWDRPFLSQAKIVDVGEGYLDLCFPAEYPVEVRQDGLVFLGDRFEAKGIDNLLEFDADTGAPATGARDNFDFRGWSRAKQLDSGAIRLFASYHPSNRFAVGNQVVIKHEKRWAPAVVLADSESIRLEQVDIFHAGGMGVIAQNCRDIDLDAVRVMPRPESGRLFSVFVDAFHFVDCLGQVRIENCVMEGQMDDAVNIHGIFLRAESIVEENGLKLRLMHHQQFGIQTLFAGDTAGFFDARTLTCLAEVKVRRAQMLNSEILEVAFESLPADLDLEHLLVMRAERGFDVRIKGCIMRDNRSRGVLFNAYGSCLIENCHFRTPWQAVRISGAVDGKWYESGPSERIEISDCTFEGCGYATGRPVIEVTAHHCGDHSFHGQVVVHDSRFELAHSNLLAVDNVSHVEFYNNQVQGCDEACLTKGCNTGLGRVESLKVEHNE